jgi:hypothetical protein
LFVGVAEFETSYVGLDEDFSIEIAACTPLIMEKRRL